MAPGVALGTSTNWSGWVNTLPAVTDHYSSVTGTWEQPPITCPKPNADSSFWVGIDGFVNNVPNVGRADGTLKNGVAGAISASMFSSPPNIGGNSAYVGHLITDSQGYLPAGTRVTSENDTTHFVTLSNQATGIPPPGSTTNDVFTIQAGSVEQAGTTAHCVGPKGLTPEYYAWWEMFGPQGNNEAPFSKALIRVHPNDTIVATATLTGNNALGVGEQDFTLRVRNATTGQAAVARPGLAGADTNISCANPNNPSFPCRQTSAEWIVEPLSSTPLANYRDVTFLRCRSAIDGGALQPISSWPDTFLDLVSRNAGVGYLAKAGKLFSAGTAFDDRWIQAGP